MGYLFFTVLSIGLLTGFLLLTAYERRTGRRVLETRRATLDAQVRRVVFIYTHVDLAAFAREESRRLATRLGHAVVHLSLQLVRTVERLLTRLVRHIRTQHAVEVRPVGETREFVKTLADFKGRLKENMPEMPPVEVQD